ncbi:hypothetical protein Tco_0836023 [Tanacetum coccineum]
MTYKTLVLEKEDSNSETASCKSEEGKQRGFCTKKVYANQNTVHCIHSTFKYFSKKDLKRLLHSLSHKRTCSNGISMSLFGQYTDTFTSITANLTTGDQLQNHLTKTISRRWIPWQPCKHFKDALLQHMGNAKKSVAEGILKQIRSANDSTGARNDTNLMSRYQPIYNKEPMAEVQLTAECNIFATGQQHTEQLEIIMKEKVFAIVALKNNLRKLKGHNVDTKFAKTSVLGKSVLQSLRNQSVVRQPNAFKSERPQMSKPRWIPTGKLFDSCMGKDDSEPIHGSNVDIPNTHECKQTLDLSASTSLTGQQKQRISFSAASLINVREVPTADMISMTSMIELEILFGPSFDEYFNGENQLVSKSFAVTTANTSDKRQQ